VACSCEYGDDPSGSGVTELVISFYKILLIKANKGAYSD
jgi:hypothetical protein